MSAYDLVSSHFNSAWAQATTKSTEASANFKSALAEGGSVPTMTPAGLTFEPNVVEPDVHIPSEAEGASLARFSEISDAVIDKLTGLFRSYMDTYFPDDSGYLAAAQAWIVKAITAGGTGLNPAVEDQIWQRDRARLLTDAARAADEITATFAARGYPMPPGAMLHQHYLLQADLQDKVAQASRDVAIKQAEIELENVRFAVDKAISLYQAATAAAGDYIKALSIGPQAGIQLVPSVTDSQSKLIGAASEYYRARIAVEELKFKARVPDAEFEQAARIKNGEWTMAMIGNRVQTAIEAAKGLSTQAAAALNGINTSASVTGGGSTSVSYSYSGDTAGEAPVQTSA